MYNIYERFMYNKIAAITIHYSFPIFVIVLIIAIIFGAFGFQMPTKCQLQFFADDDPIQKAYALVLNGFATAINDFSFFYLWGLEDTTDVSFWEKKTVDLYGKPSYKTFNITDPEVQEHLQWAWSYTLNQLFIDPNATQNFGVSPWEMWNTLFDISKQIEVYLPLIQPFANITSLPDRFPLSPSDYSSASIIWQGILSKLAYQEPDAYVPGTLKANTI
jgi:hypothetical protein